jgi:hypothetical protein
VSFSLKNHPFAVEAFFELSLVLTFAVPTSQLKDLIPACLELETFNDKWAFIAIAVVQTKSLRPKGFPALFGNDFTLIGYRIFVSHTNSKGKRLRGLYILKSETDKKRMEVLGNIFTQYNYTTTDIKIVKKSGSIEVNSSESGLKISVDESQENAPLPINSPFANWKEARRFAGPLPFTFDYNERTHQVLTIQGVRDKWMPRPVKVLKNQIPFLQELGLNDVVLANAFILQDIPYYWKKGKLELWQV